MEIQLSEFIDQIKKEGVEAAEAKAAALLDDAKARAEQIIANAKIEADKIMADAKEENDRAVKSGEEAIKQAGRNLLISFRESVAREISTILNKNVSSVYSSDALADIVINAVKRWSENPELESLDIILNSSDLEKFEETILSGFNEKIKEGITLKANDNFDGGFRILVNGGNAYYDYSAEAVVDMLSKYLSPKVTKLLKEAE